MYFIGKYEQAIDYIEKSKLILNDKNLTLKSILNKHQAVIDVLFCCFPKMRIYH